MFKKSLTILFAMAGWVMSPATGAEPPNPATALAAVHPGLRIVGGETAEPGQWPWMASLYYRSGISWSFECGATLIAPTWILTAAHCVTDDNGRLELASQHQVAVGIYRESSVNSSNRIGVKRIVTHPGWNLDSLEYDIALLELQQAVDSAPVLLNEGGSLPVLSTTMGWGLTQDGGNSSDRLRQVDLPLVSNAQCQAVYDSFSESVYGSREIIGSAQICAGYLQGGKDSCQGDSGGPLVVRNGSEWQQVGIVSFGEFPDPNASCAAPGSYGVYTRVSSYRDFIRSVVPEARFATAGQATVDATLTHVNLPGVSYSGQFGQPAGLYWAGLSLASTQDLTYRLDGYGVLPAGSSSQTTLSSSGMLVIPELVWQSSPSHKLSVSLKQVEGQPALFRVLDYRYQ
ncbi:MAG: serine protease [Pseudomonadota bacterium]